MSSQKRPKEYQSHFNFDSANGHADWLRAFVKKIEETALALTECTESAGGCITENEIDCETIAAFVEGSLKNSESEHIRRHVFSCEHCADSVVRVARMCQEFEADFDFDVSNGAPEHRAATSFSDRGQIWLDWFEQAGLRPDGLTMFPDGTIADDAWEFGHLIEGEQSESRLSLLSHATANVIQESTDSNKVLIVAFSDAMHEVGVRAAAFIKQSRYDVDIHVVGARGFHTPRLLCKSKIITGMSVVLLFDVVRNGRLLEQLWRIIDDHSPKEIFAVTMVNQDYQGCYSNHLLALASETKTRRREDLMGHPKDFFNLRYFDPASGRSRETQQSDIDNGWDIEGIRDLLPHIQATNAFKQNFRIGKSSYPFAIDVSELLGDVSAREIIFSRAQQKIGFWAGQNVVFVYPASRETRSGRVAELFSVVTGNNYAGLGDIDESGFLVASSENRKKLESCDGVVIVDAAIRSGTTLQSQFEILRKLDVPVKGAVYVLDLRRPRDVRANTRDIDIEIESLFQVPLGFAPATSIKALLKNRFHDLLSFLDENTFSEDVTSALTTFHERLFTKRRGFTKVVASEKVEHVIAKGTIPRNRIVEGIATGNRPNFSLTGFLDAEHGMSSSLYRDAKYTINNSASTQVLRELALTFASNCDYTWLTKSWLTLHEHLLTSPDTKWDFLPVIAMDAALRSPHQVNQILTTVEEYHDSYESRIVSQSRGMLFDGVTRNELVTTRCRTLKEILVKTPKINKSKK